ncbi:hypothetical protein F5B17DRAFT_434793 [Nemania serpens]|nr:hypothetical protein F5B17DRAFT_434793 [Nemania serpens]
MPPDFEKQSYWHERFASETCFEWLVPSSTFMPLIAPYLSASASQRILNLGSGTSDLHTHFRARGYHDVTNVDNEPRALERGREIEERVFGNARTHYAVADGTADAVSCGREAAVRDMAWGVRECLIADGVWISLSYSATRFELKGLPFDVRVVGKILTPKARPTEPDVFYWCYLLRPG